MGGSRQRTGRDRIGVEVNGNDETETRHTRHCRNLHDGCMRGRIRPGTSGSEARIRRPVFRTAGADCYRRPAQYRRQENCGGRHAGGAAGSDRVAKSAGDDGPGSRQADADRCDLPHLFHVQGTHESRRDDALRGRAVPAGRPGVEVYSRVQESQGAGETGIRPALQHSRYQRNHDTQSADAHFWPYL